MSGLRLCWHLFKHDNCHNGQIHFATVNKAKTLFAEIFDCVKDYVNYIQDGDCFASSGTYEVRIFSEEDPYMDSQQYDGFISVNGIDEVETAQNHQLQNKQNFVNYIWVVLEKTNCGSDNHFQIMERSVNTFASVKDCLLDFRVVSTYDKFNISRDWYLHFEVIC